MIPDQEVKHKFPLHSEAMAATQNNIKPIIEKSVKNKTKESSQERKFMQLEQDPKLDVLPDPVEAHQSLSQQSARTDALMSQPGDKYDDDDNDQDL